MSFALLFWPALGLAAVVSTLGITHRAPGLLVTGAVLSLPASLYLAASPGFGLTALLLPLCHVAGAFAMRKDHRWAAAIPLLAFVGFFGWMALEIAR
jgi:hypothetical protein